MKTAERPITWRRMHNLPLTVTPGLHFSGHGKYARLPGDFFAAAGL